MVEKKNRAAKSGKARFARRWHQPAALGAVSADKTYLTDGEVRGIVNESLTGKFWPSFNLYLGDAEYYCPPKRDVEEILELSKVDRYQWTEDLFDCDDFAHVLKAHFAEAAYKDGQRRKAHCFGVVWGSLPDAHAINWVITDDRQLWFIEPQSVARREDKIFSPRKNDRDIYFMLC